MKIERNGTPTTVTITAAASLAGALNAMKPELLGPPYFVDEVDIYQGSSGYLAGRLLGAIQPQLFADIFFPAAWFPMEDLIDPVAAGFPGPPLVIGSTVSPVLGNKLVLIKNKNAGWSTRPAITGFEDVTYCNTVAVGTQIFVAIPYNYNDVAYNVPAGRYAKTTFQYFGNWGFVKNHATFTNMWNVTQVLNAVANAGGPAIGVVYKTDALSRPNDVEIIACAPPCVNSSIIYPIAPLLNSDVDELILESVINFIKGPGMIHFTSRGFIDLNQV